MVLRKIMNTHADVSELLFDPKSDDEESILFAEEESNENDTSQNNKKSWKILIVDDEHDIHSVTKLALIGVCFDAIPLEFISAYSGKEAQKIISDHPDIALILLDVVMESEDAGLQVAEFVRRTQKNALVRIVLRTGQPGYAPERSIIINYDINDYKEKSELTSQKLFTVTISSLRSYRDILTILKERKIKQAFSSYLAPELVEFLSKNPDSVKLAGEEKIVTCLFADIRNFTAMGEVLSPKQLVNLLNEILGPCTEIIFKNHGMLDKYIGDAFMALFNAPVPIEHHADKALNAACEIVDKMSFLNRYWAKRNWPNINLGIGIHSGMAVVGNIGTVFRFDYTAIGDTINTASRLEGLNKFYGTDILTTESTIQLLNKDFLTIPIDRVQVKGKLNSFWVHALIPEKSPENEAMKSTFMAGAELYLQKNFAGAIKQFQKIKKNGKNNYVSLYIERCEQFLQEPPPADWNGVVRIDRK